jgi:hypothetical protein
LRFCGFLWKNFEQAVETRNMNPAAECKDFGYTEKALQREV